MIVSLLALLFVVLIIVLICKGCSGRIDALAGKWDFDGTTAYEFDGKGSGAMLLTLADYDFTYEIKDNQLYIDFVNESAHDATYEFSVKGDTLILIGGEGTIGGTYELTKVHDKKDRQIRTVLRYKKGMENPDFICMYNCFFFICISHL